MLPPSYNNEEIITKLFGTEISDLLVLLVHAKGNFKNGVVSYLFFEYIFSDYDLNYYEVNLC